MFAEAIIPFAGLYRDGNSSIGIRSLFQFSVARCGRVPFPEVRMGTSPTSCQPIFPLESAYAILNGENGHLFQEALNSSKVRILGNCTSVSNETGSNQVAFMVIENSGNLGFSSELPLNTRSNTELRKTSLSIFDRTFAITGILKLLLGGVAVIGIFSALMSVQLERSREFAVLRAIGMTPLEIGKMVCSQCMLMGILAGLFASVSYTHLTLPTILLV